MILTGVRASETIIYRASDWDSSAHIIEGRFRKDRLTRKEGLG